MLPATLPASSPSTSPQPRHHGRASPSSPRPSMPMSKVGNPVQPSATPNPGQLLPRSHRHAPTGQTSYSLKKQGISRILTRGLLLLQNLAEPSATDSLELGAPARIQDGQLCSELSGSSLFHPVVAAVAALPLLSRQHLPDLGRPRQTSYDWDRAWTASTKRVDGEIQSRADRQPDACFGAWQPRPTGQIRPPAIMLGRLNPVLLNQRVETRVYVLACLPPRNSLFGQTAPGADEPVLRSPRGFRLIDRVVATLWWSTRLPGC